MPRPRRFTLAQLNATVRGLARNPAPKGRGTPRLLRQRRTRLALARAAMGRAAHNVTTSRELPRPDQTGCAFARSLNDSTPPDPPEETERT